MKKPAYQRIMEKVTIDDNGCWLFTGATDARGYGKVSIGHEGRKKRYVDRCHRIMYVAVFGPIPNGMVIRHKCDVKRCCNPYHVELGTKSENAYDYYRRQRKDACTTPSQDNLSNNVNPTNSYEYDEGSGRFINDAPF